MTVIINGTTGVTSVNGSAAAPSVTGTDTDTGIVYGTNTLSFATNGATVGTFDASGYLTVGTTTNIASSRLVAYRSSGEIARFCSPNGTSGYIAVGRDDNAAEGFTVGYSSSTGDCTLTAVSVSHPIIFKQNTTERARIDGNALTMAAIRLVISGASGIPAPTNNGDGNIGTTAAGGINIIGKGSTYDIVFLNKNGFTAGYVATGATTITTSSDERLKENNQPITGALDIVCQMRHETGNYKSDPDRQVAFLIAQDVDALFPYAVEKTDPEQMGVNYNWIIPLHGAAITELTALVKEQQAIITQLQADVAALKGN